MNHPTHPIDQACQAQIELIRRMRKLRSKHPGASQDQVEAIFRRDSRLMAMKGQADRLWKEAGA